MQPTAQLQHLLHKLLPYMNEKLVCPAHCMHMPYCLGHIWGMFVNICATYEVISINYVTRTTVHVLSKLHFMLLAYITNKYDCHIPNIGHTVFLLYWHIDLTLMHACAKTQPSATCTLHVIGIYMPETNMPTKLYIYAIFFMHIYGGYICIYVTPVKSWVSTIWPGMLHTEADDNIDDTFRLHSLQVAARRNKSAMTNGEKW